MGIGSSLPPQLGKHHSNMRSYQLFSFAICATLVAICIAQEPRDEWDETLNLTGSSSGIIGVERTTDVLNAIQTTASLKTCDDGDECDQVYCGRQIVSDCKRAANVALQECGKSPAEYHMRDPNMMHTGGTCRFWGCDASRGAECNGCAEAINVLAKMTSYACLG